MRWYSRYFSSTEYQIEPCAVDYAGVSWNFNRRARQTVRFRSHLREVRPPGSGRVGRYGGEWDSRPRFIDNRILLMLVWGSPERGITTAGLPGEGGREPTGGEGADVSDTRRATERIDEVGNLEAVSKSGGKGLVAWLGCQCVRIFDAFSGLGGRLDAEEYETT